MCVLLWGRGVRLFDSLDEAIESAIWVMDSDNDWVDRIEVVGDPGGPSRVIEDGELFALVNQHEVQRSAALPPPKPHVANVFVDDEVLESFYGDEGVTGAEALVDRLRPRLGDRIYLRLISNSRYVASR